MAPVPDTLLSLLPRSLFTDTATINSDTSAMSPMAVGALHLAKRDATKFNPAQGSRPPTAFNNKGFQALFALIGMGMVLTAIWFFFWAKNGGFKFRDGDWEDYKSTVLRRKGPDGKTLSNATKSTKLGGGSVVHGGSYGAESSIGYTDETGTSADFSEMREVEEGKGRAFGLRGGDARKSSRPKREHGNSYKDPELREYRSEKPARVGGINRQADGVYTDYSATASDLGSNVSSRPLVKDKATAKDKKKEAKEKERRAKERMKAAKAAEKNAQKTAAAEAKAQKVAEKQQAKKEKAEQKKVKKTMYTESEATPSEAPVSEAPRSKAPVSEATPSEAPTAELAPGRRAPPSAAYSFTTGDDTATVYTGMYTENRSAPSEYNESSYYSDYRPNADPAAYPNSRSRRDRSERRERGADASSRHSSPRKHRASRQSATSDIFTQANGDVQGTISYPCYIPGLSSAGSVGVSESVSQVGGPSHGARKGRDVMDGYRRGGVRAVGRRDSLSDSDA